jgi:hypothetical protein
MTCHDRHVPDEQLVLSASGHSATCRTRRRTTALRKRPRRLKSAGLGCSPVRTPAVDGAMRQVLKDRPGRTRLAVDRDGRHAKCCEAIGVR